MELGFAVRLAYREGTPEDAPAPSQDDVARYILDGLARDGLGVDVVRVDAEKRP